MINLSYSTISSFLACPSRVMYQQQGVRTAKSAALCYGSVFHTVLAKRLHGEYLAVANAFVPWLAKTNLAEERSWNGEIEFSNNDWPIDVMIPWIEQAVGIILAAPSRPQATELRLSRIMKFPDIEVKFTGIIDALWNGTLVDFKLASKYYKVDALQAACYAILNGGPSKFQFVVVYKEKTPRVEIQEVRETLDADYLKWVEERVVRPTGLAIQCGNFPANISYQFCTRAFCPYFRICRGGSGE